MLGVTAEARSGQESANYRSPRCWRSRQPDRGRERGVIISHAQGRRQCPRRMLLGRGTRAALHREPRGHEGPQREDRRGALELAAEPVPVRGGRWAASCRVLRVGALAPDRRGRAGDRRHRGRSNASAILAGVVVFRDPLGSEALTVVVRVVAFLLVIAAAALIPAPTPPRAIPSRSPSARQRGTRSPSGSARARGGAALAPDGAAEQERADHRDDRRDERDAEAHDAQGGEDETHDRDDAGHAPHERELVGAALAAPSRGGSA